MDFSDPSANLTLADGTTVTGFEAVQFTAGSGNDVITSSISSVNAFIDGGAGDDTLTAAANGADLRGGAGNDTLYGSAERDVLDGGDGDDVIFGGGQTSATEVITGGTGNDTIYGNLGGIYNISGEDGDDIIDLTGGGTSTASGGNGNDSITGGAGNDTLNGGAGNDLFYYVAGGGRDRVDGGADTDTLDISGSAADESIFIETPAQFTARTGSFIADNGQLNVSFGTVIKADAFNIETFVVHGGGGNDTINGLGVFDGGTGNDALIAPGASSNDTYVFAIGDGTDSIAESGGTDDRILMANGGAAFSTLRAYDDNIGTTAGNLVIVYDGGQITVTNFYAASANRVESIRFDGGSFNGYQLGTGDYALNSSDGAGTRTGTAGNDLIAGEDGAGNTLSGLAGNDLLFGGSQGDTLDGGADNDLLVGGDGNDILTGGSGTDVLDGGAGNDTFNDNDIDTTLIGGAGVDTWNASVSGKNHAFASGASLSSVEQLRLTLGAGVYTVTAGDDAGEGTDNNGDILTVSYGALTSNVTHTISGDGSGTIGDGINSIVYTDEERVVIVSGSGNDTLVADMRTRMDYTGGGGTDTLVVDGSTQTGTVTLNTFAPGGSDWNAGVLGLNTGFFRGFEAIDATGGSGNDTFVVKDGSVIAATLRGGAGNDSISVTGTVAATLIGGDGNDTLSTSGAIPALVDGGNGTDTWNGTVSGTNAIFAPSASIVSIENLRMTLGTGVYTVTAGEDIAAGEGTSTNGDILTVSYGALTTNITHTTSGDGSGTIGDGIDNSIVYTDEERVVIVGGSGNDTLVADMRITNDFNGGLGNDTLVVDGSHTGAMHLDTFAPGGSDWNAGFGGTNTGFFRGFEAVDATGGDGNDSFTLRDGSVIAATLRGGLGNDTFTTSNGDIVTLIDGGGGIDTWNATVSGTTMSFGPSAAQVDIELLRLTLGDGYLHGARRRGCRRGYRRQWRHPGGQLRCVDRGGDTHAERRRLGRDRRRHQLDRLHKRRAGADHERVGQRHAASPTCGSPTISRRAAAPTRW